MLLGGPLIATLKAKTHISHSARGSAIELGLSTALNAPVVVVVLLLLLLLPPPPPPPPPPLRLGMQYCVVHALNIVTDATCKDGTMPRSALRNMVMHEQQSCDAICRF